MLESVLKLEYLAAYAYTAAIPLLSGQSLVAARQFLHHELAHITVLHSLIESAHSKPSAQQSSYPLGHPEGTRELLGLLHRIEARLLGAYLHAIPRLSAGGVRSVAAAIMANEGQHIAMLRGRLDLDPVPAALPTASE